MDDLDNRTIPASNSIAVGDGSHCKKIIGTQDRKLAVSTVITTAAAMPKSLSKEYDNMEVSMLSMQELAPKDHMEAILCSEITALDAQGMRYLSRAEREGNLLCHIEAYVNLATKLLKLKNENIEMLMRYRRNGEQKVVVQHINVSDSAKAIIGDLNMGGGGGYV